MPSGQRRTRVAQRQIQQQAPLTGVPSRHCDVLGNRRKRVNEEMTLGDRSELFQTLELGAPRDQREKEIWKGPYSLSDQIPL